LKRSRLFSSVAVLAVGASLITAAPARAAVSLPAGCTTGEGVTQVSEAAEVYSMACTNLADSADLRTYTNLSSLNIGPIQTGPSTVPSAVTLTRLPPLPASLVFLEVDAPRITNFDSLAGLTSLQSLGVHGSAVANLGTLSGLQALTYLSLEGTGYWGADLSPLSGLSNLEFLNVMGHNPARLNAVEGVWANPSFPRGLDGKHLLPDNVDVIDNNNRRYKEYQFDAATGRIKYSGGRVGIIILKRTALPQIASLPKLKWFQIFLSRPVTVAAQAEWSKDKANVLVVTGTVKVGGVVTARNKYGSGMKDYADVFQWKRDGKAIPGARGKSYKLVAADVGHRITVTGTDTKNIWFNSAALPIIPYSQDALVASKLLSSFAYTAPDFTTTGRAGRDLTHRVKPVRTPAGTRIAYQWRRNGAPIRGAVGPAYRLTSADRGKVITVSTSWIKPGYYTASGTSRRGMYYFW
jgi:hypothetical protein